MTFYTINGLGGRVIIIVYFFLICSKSLSRDTSLKKYMYEGLNTVVSQSFKKKKKNKYL